MAGRIGHLQPSRPTPTQLSLPNTPSQTRRNALVSSSHTITHGPPAVLRGPAKDKAKKHRNRHTPSPRRQRPWTRSGDWAQRLPTHHTRVLGLPPCRLLHVGIIGIGGINEMIGLSIAQIHNNTPAIFPNFWPQMHYNITNYP